MHINDARAIFVMGEAQMLRSLLTVLVVAGSFAATHDPPPSDISCDIVSSPERCPSNRTQAQPGVRGNARALAG